MTALATDLIERLLSRVAMKDRAAFDALYEVAGAKLFGVCRRLLKDEADAEEVMQEVWIRIWQKAASAQTSGAPATAWLVTVARNAAIDRLRARKPQASDIDTEFSLASNDPSPEQDALASDDRRQLDVCLETLEPAKADAIRGAYLDGYTYDELAKRHDVPLNTMRTWLRRGLIKLKACLEGQS